jgi:hypothetical protein
VFVGIGAATSDRPHADLAPISGSSAEIARRLREFADAGVEEAILVVTPITVDSIRRLGDVVAVGEPAPKVLLSPRPPSPE